MNLDFLAPPYEKKEVLLLLTLPRQGCATQPSGLEGRLVQAARWGIRNGGVKLFSCEEEILHIQIICVASSLMTWKLDGRVRVRAMMAD